MNLRNVARRIRRNLAGSIAAGGAGAYTRRLLAETRFFSRNQKAQELPAIYDYWSNTYVRPQLEPFGFAHPEAMFLQYFEAAYHASTAAQRRFLSVGTGNCETEIRLARDLVLHGCREFVIDCLELNARLLASATEQAQAQGVAAHIRTVQCDFNKWQPTSTYDAVLANNSLHHVLNLEGLLGGIKSSLAPTGSFVTSDMIGRNGHMRWPEALAIVEEFWPELPKQYTYNHLLRRHEARYDNWDCSVGGFEGIRAQDILPLLIENFEFDLFVAFANVIDVFIDRPFGHNFQVGNAWDIDFIDRVAARDSDEILRGAIKPCHILAAMCNGRPAQKRMLPGLTPEFCVRSPDHPPVAHRERRRYG